MQKDVFPNAEDRAGAWPAMARRPPLPPALGRPACAHPRIWRGGDCAPEPRSE
jgi:hypothetical protein